LSPCNLSNFRVFHNPPKLFVHLLKGTNLPGFNQNPLTLVEVGSFKKKKQPFNYVKIVLNVYVHLRKSLLEDKRLGLSRPSQAPAYNSWIGCGLQNVFFPFPIEYFKMILSRVLHTFSNHSKIAR
jgi:hypothetical protein